MATANAKALQHVARRRWRRRYTRRRAMSAHASRRYVDDLLSGQHPKPFRPDDFEAAQIRTAIELRATRLGADAPRQEFLTDLHRRMAAQIRGTPPEAPAGRSSTTGGR